MRVVHSFSEADSLSWERQALRNGDEIVVPIFALRAVRREFEASPIQCFVPRLLPAAFARGVVIESDDEGLAARRMLEASALEARLPRRN